MQLLGRGGVSVAVLMALGEATSIFQNSWYIARDLRKDSPVRRRSVTRILLQGPSALILARCASDQHSEMRTLQQSVTRLSPPLSAHRSAVCATKHVIG